MTVMVSSPQHRSSPVVTRPMGCLIRRSVIKFRPRILRPFWCQRIASGGNGQHIKRLGQRDATAAGLFNASVNATNPGGNGMLSVTITISAANQTITFGTQGAQSFAPGATFAINPLASASSNLAVTYSTTTPAVCSVSGTTVTMLHRRHLHHCSQPRRQHQFQRGLAGSAKRDHQPDRPRRRLPSAPPRGQWHGHDCVHSADEQRRLTGHALQRNLHTERCGEHTVSPINIMGLANNTQYTCSVTASNAVGPSVASGNVMVTPQDSPVPPQFTSANAVTFTVLQANTFNVTASGTPAPALSLQSGTQPNGVNF